VTRVVLRVANHGYLATYGLPSAAALPHAEPMRLTARGEGVELLAPAAGMAEIGHLQGWGSGLYGGGSVFSPTTHGNGHERFVTLVVRGAGRVWVEVSSCRTGTLSLTLPVG
jgi:hypothetical protein